MSRIAPDCIVIGAAPADADRFGHGDLDVVDVLRVPERLEQDIGKAHRHQVLHRLLAEVMVDPVDLAFAEMRRQRRVQRACRGKVAAEGLFDDDARLLASAMPC